MRLKTLLTGRAVDRSDEGSPTRSDRLEVLPRATLRQSALEHVVWPA